MFMDNLKDNLKLTKPQKWRRTLDTLLSENGKDMKWLCEYVGTAYNENSVAFYEKLPRKRSTYIGIGMAFKQPLDVINTWIMEFSSQKKLYIKDVSEDLVWIYLIKLNEQDKDSDINYFRRYEECQALAQAAYSEVWESVINDSVNTADVEVRLDKAEFDEGFTGLTRFISENIDSFKTAYTRPRQYLNDYIVAIFRADYSEQHSQFTNLSSLRGYLDDAMINYLSGDHTTINTYDRTSRKRSLRIKYIPKGRKFHISLCLALGMSAEEIDRYLELMGYAPLRAGDKTEGLLQQLLAEWKSSHPLQRAFKDRLLSPGGTSALADTGSSFAEYTAFQEELLFLREELYNNFMERGLKFPYMK